MTRTRLTVYVVGVAALVAVIVYVAVLQWGATVTVSSKVPADADEELLTNPELVRARSAHETTVNWVAACLGAVNVHELPNTYSSVMATTIFNFSVNDHIKLPTRLMVPQENQIISLSKAIFERRINSANRASESQKLWARMQWIVIFIGLVTTVLVSLTSTEFGRPGTSVGNAIRVLAIIFPALGTAASAANAFYSPRDEVIDSSKSLAGLSHLQDQIAVGVWVLACNPKPDSDSWKENDKKIGEWFKRYQDLINVSENAVTAGSRAAEKPAGQGVSFIQNR